MMARALRLDGGLILGGSPGDSVLTAPKWCRIFPGPTTRYRHDFPDEGISFDDAFFDSVIAGWKALGSVPLPVDYAHREDEIAAGWIVDIRKDGAGNLDVAIEWTARAKAAIEASELRYLSPTFALEHINPLTGGEMGATLFGAALLNTPFLHDLPAVSASKTRATGVTVDPKEFFKKVCSIFGLADDMGDAECLEYLAAKAAPQKDEPVVDPYAVDAKRAAAVAEAIELTSAPLRASLASLEGEKSKLSARIAELEADRLRSGIEDLVRVSMSRGVANAAACVEKAMKIGGSLDSARDIMALMAPTVVTAELGHGAPCDQETTKDGAFARLRKIADSIESSESVRPSKAFELAILRNPELAALSRGR